MTTTSEKMNRLRFACILKALFILTLFSACNKVDIFKKHPPKDSDNPASQSATVIEKWMAMQIRLMKNTTGVPNQAFSRHYAYSGIAAWESIAPGLPEHKQWDNKWNGLTGLPQPNQGKHYYWPASANAALAAMNRALFPNAGAACKSAIDSLENALLQQFPGNSTTPLITRSADFGKAVALAVYNWAETDGYKNAGSPYTPPTGPGLWKPTPPSFGAASTPYWGNNRPVVKSSTNNTQPAAPIAYSTQVNSPFYSMVKKVYDVSQTLTAEQQAVAFYWRDVPGATSPGHWLNIVLQVLQQKNTSLAKAALSYALTGSSINDALISCWKAKYQYNLVRPVSYIREVIKDTAWSSIIGTPPHPEYPSAHAALSGAAAAAMEKLFGNARSFTDHTYDYLGYAPRSYASYTAIGKEAGLSRLYAGIHYVPSIEAGLLQGKKVAENIFRYPAFKY